MVEIFTRSDLEEEAKGHFFSCQKVEFEKFILKISMGPLKTHKQSLSVL